jgi:hypothetical protein
MRIPNATQQAQDWRIHDLVQDFRLEDVWAYPSVTGSAADFDDLLALVTSNDPVNGDSAATRFLWRVRDLLGRWFGLGSITTPAEPADGSLLARLPNDLRGTANDIRFERLPFVSLFRTENEFAAEIINRTVHGIMHLGWVADGENRYHGQMAVYVKPNGLFGQAYMAFIKPFRYAIVYPAQEKQVQRQWTTRRTYEH